MSRSSTRDYGYLWLMENLEEFTETQSGIFFASRLPAMLSYFCSVERADHFAQALRPRFAGKAGGLELERAIERVRNCGVLDDRKGAEISAGFARLR